MFHRFSVILYLIIFSILCSACTTGRKCEKYTDARFEDGDKGVVLFSVIANARSLEFIVRKAGDSKVSYTIRSGEGLFGILASADPQYDSNNLLFLEPGIYYVDYIQLLDTGGQRMWLPSPGLKNGLVQYGAFEVVAKKVFAIDSLVCNTPKLSGILSRASDGEINFVSKDYGALIHEQLKKSQYQNLLSHMEKGMLYERGSIVYKDKSGKFRILSKQEVDLAQKEMVDATIQHLEAKH